jgi:hypothetical protein
VGIELTLEICENGAATQVMTECLKGIWPLVMVHSIERSLASRVGLAEHRPAASGSESLCMTMRFVEVSVEHAAPESDAP